MSQINKTNTNKKNMVKIIDIKETAIKELEESDKDKIINKLKEEIEELKKKNKELEEKLKSYTNAPRHKKYYEKNSEIVKEKAKTYMEKIKETDPEKLKQWRRTAYLNRKAKLQNEKNNDNNNNFDDV